MALLSINYMCSAIFNIINISSTSSDSLLRRTGNLVFQKFLCTVAN